MIPPALAIIRKSEISGEFFSQLLFHEHFAYVVTLTTDIETVGGILNFHAREVEVFNRSVGILVNHDTVNACAKTRNVEVHRYLGRSNMEKITDIGQHSSSPSFRIGNCHLAFLADVGKGSG